MVKSIFIFICICFYVSCTPSNISSNIISNKVTLPTNPVERIDEPEITEVQITDKECVLNRVNDFNGVEEIGQNKDFNNPELKHMLKLAGWKPGQAWCSYYVKGVLDHCQIPNKITGWSPSSFNKKDVIFTDGKYVRQPNSEDIMVMSLSYNKYQGDKTRYKAIGHTGFVERIVDNRVYTDEGNAFADNTNSNEGQGKYKKIRPLTRNLHITNGRQQ